MKKKSTKRKMKTEMKMMMKTKHADGIIIRTCVFFEIETE